MGTGHGARKHQIYVHLGLWISGSVIMAFAAGVAGARGMLCRTSYVGGEFEGYTLMAIVGGVLVSIGFLAFLVNLVDTLGLKNVPALFVLERWLAWWEPVQAQSPKQRNPRGEVTRLPRPLCIPTHSPAHHYS